MYGLAISINAMVCRVVVTRIMDGVGHQQTLVTKFDLAGKVVPAIDIYFLATLQIFW